MVTTLSIKFAEMNHHVIGSARRAEMIDHFVKELDDPTKIKSYI